MFVSDVVKQQLAPTGVLRAGINLSNFLLVSGAAADGGPKGISPDIANLVASNLSVENRLKENHTIGFRNGNYQMGNNTWYWQINTSSTPNDGILKLSLNVFNSKKALNNKNSTSQLELFVSK